MLRVLAHAKINVALAVLAKRADGFHEIRTVFQTISLADRLTVAFRPARRTSIRVTASVEIPGENLCTRAADLLLESAGRTGEVEIHIDKRIPMGGGLGGGSTDAAATLMALSAQMKRAVALQPLAEKLGSDVPFFLYGGTALGAGRGEELYPLPDLPSAPGLLVFPQVHVSTKDAYAALARPFIRDLTPEHRFPILERLQSLAWAIRARKPRAAWWADCRNDFEEVVFRQYPLLQSLRRKLEQAGAAPALMTGSGAALFGLFEERSAVQAAMGKLRAQTGVSGVVRFTLLSHSLYQSRWNRWLSGFGGWDAIRPAENLKRKRERAPRAGDLRTPVR